MTQEMLTSAGEIIRILDSCDDTDRVTILAMIDSRYQFGTTNVNPTSIRKKEGKGGGETSAAKKAPAATETDFLTKVMLRLKPLIVKLPQVTRQQGSEKPHMDLKSVQKRLNRKRSELQKALSLLADQPEEAYWAYESLNKIQAFRIAAKDGSTTKGSRLATDPIPKEWDQLLPILEETSKTLIESDCVSSNGFFTDEDHDFSPPAEAGETRSGADQATSQDEVVW